MRSVAFAVLAWVLVPHAASVVRSQAQVFGTPVGTVTNVRFEQNAGGVVTLSYDLVSEDLSATFAIDVEISSDGGTTFDVRPVTVTGDIGAAVRPGRDKRIVWQAGRDVENLQIDRFRFNIRASSGAARPLGAGTLSVTSTPAGATVLVDGVARGTAPVDLRDLTVGRHDVVIRLEGHQEQRRVVDLRLGAAEVLTVTLPAATATGNAPQTPPVVAQNRGRSKLPWILGGVGVAGAGAAVALSGKKDTPQTPTEVCGNGADDDRDGRIDEDCPEVCGNRIDDNGNGQVDETCTCTFTATTGRFQVSSDAGSSTVQVSATNAPCTGGSWSTGSGSQPWLSANPTSGSAAADVQLRFEANTTTTSREASIAVAGQTSTVVQAGRAAPPVTCTFQANFVGGDGSPPNSTNTSVPGDCEGAGCGTRRVAVTASNAACTWTVDGTPSWFAEIERPGAGSRTIQFQVYERNTTGRERNASFRVAGVNFTVTQCAGRC